MLQLACFGLVCVITASFVAFSGSEGQVVVIAGDLLGGLIVVTLISFIIGVIELKMRQGEPTNRTAQLRRVKVPSSEFKRMKR